MRVFLMSSLRNGQVVVSGIKSVLLLWWSAADAPPWLLLLLFDLSTFRAFLRSSKIDQLKMFHEDPLPFGLKKY